MAKSLGKSIVNPLNLGVAAGAATLAIGLGSLPLGLLGGLAYGAMVAFDAIHARKRTGSLALPELPDPRTITDPATRAAIVKIISATRELERALRETPPDAIATLTTALASVQELEGHAARLVARSEDITRHLAGVDLPALVAEVRQLAERADATHDADASQTFRVAKASRMDELHTLKELKAAKDRLDADLMRIVAVIAALPTKVVHMRALDAAAMDQISGDLHSELAAVGNELKASEEVMKQLGDIAR